VTPSEPWTIRDQVSHLAFFEEQAALAAHDADGFGASLAAIFDQGLDAYMATGLDRGRAMSPEEVLDWWRRVRRATVDALRRHHPDDRLPWYGPPMRAASSAVARLMETWAHGQDVLDALDMVRGPTDRLFRVAELGVKTFRFGFENRGLETPDRKVRVALRGPGGTVRVWNDDCTDSVTGPVEEFCLVVAHRRNVADTHLVIEGAIARRWMEVAQVFAGPPGPGRPPAGSGRR
jgi:uncharacterized protein (TIGR03084 family)